MKTLELIDDETNFGPDRSFFKPVPRNSALSNLALGPRAASNIKPEPGAFSNLKPGHRAVSHQKPEPGIVSKLEPEPKSLSKLQTKYLYKRYIRPPHTSPTYGAYGGRGWRGYGGSRLHYNRPL